MRTVHNHFKSTGFPFERILFINPNTNSKGDWKFYIGELFPEFGYNEYEPRDLVKKMEDLD